MLPAISWRYSRESIAIEAVKASTASEVGALKHLLALVVLALAALLPILDFRFWILDFTENAANLPR